MRTTNYGTSAPDIHSKQLAEGLHQSDVEILNKEAAETAKDINAFEVINCQ